MPLPTEPVTTLQVLIFILFIIQQVFFLFFFLSLFYFNSFFLFFSFVVVIISQSPFLKIIETYFLQIFFKCFYLSLYHLKLVMINMWKKHLLFWLSDDVQRRLYLPFFTEQIPICVVCLCVFCPASTLALEQVHSLSWRGVQLLWQMSSLCSPYKNVFFFSHIIKVFLFTHNKWSVLASLLVCDHTLLSILVLCVGPFMT